MFLFQIKVTEVMGSSWQRLEEKEAPKKNFESPSGSLKNCSWRLLQDITQKLASERSERNEDKDGHVMFWLSGYRVDFTSNNILYFHLFLHISLNLHFFPICFWLFILNLFVNFQDVAWDFSLP